MIGIGSLRGKNSKYVMHNNAYNYAKYAFFRNCIGILYDLVYVLVFFGRK